jgi:hypothetical protein
MERLIRRVVVCAWVLISPLAFAQQVTVTAGNQGRCNVSWELDSVPRHSLESPWGTVALGKNGIDPAKEWNGQTASGIRVTIFPEGTNGKGNLVRFSFAVCQRVTAVADGITTVYVVTPKATLLRPGYWYFEPKGSFDVEMKGSEVQTTGLSTGHGLVVKLLPSQTKKDRGVNGPDKWKFDIVMTCKEDKCVTPAGIAVRDTLP